MEKGKGKVRVAIIGTGLISSAHARGILAQKEKIECVALCDVAEQKLKARSDQLGGIKAQYKDSRKMLADTGEQIDAVIICLPHHLHARCILDAAAAGKHILCEKPMCTSLKEADAIAAAVRKSGVTYMSAHNQLFMPSVREAKRMIDSGELGRILWLRSQDCFHNAAQALKGTWRANLRKQGGGELIDTGYHPCYRLLYLAGLPAVAGSEVVAVRGSMGRFEQEIEGEDTAAVQVRFANGAIGEVLTSWAFNNPHGTHQIHVIAERGQVFGSGNTLYFLPAGYAEPAKKNLPQVETFSEQIRHFADCLLTGTRPIHSVEEGRVVLEIILRATKDARGWQPCAPK